MDITADPARASREAADATEKGILAGLAADMAAMDAMVKATTRILHTARVRIEADLRGAGSGVRRTRRVITRNGLAASVQSGGGTTS
jgi:hypothetical protein